MVQNSLKSEVFEFSRGASAPSAPHRTDLIKMKYSDECAPSDVVSENIWLCGSISKTLGGV